jgi:hypothetical protein
MELFRKLFGSLLLFTYHCFDRVVIHGYLSALSRPENVVHFFHSVLGISPITKETLSARTTAYRQWVDAYARKHGIPQQWAEPGVRKQDDLRPLLRRMERKGHYGVYCILMSMEQGPTFRVLHPKFPTADPNYRIVHKHRSRYMHYYFYLRDEVLGPMVMRVGTFLPFQTTYYLNGHSFMAQELTRRGVRFRKQDNAFLGIDRPQLLQAVADRFRPEVIQARLQHWTLALGPKFSRKERSAMYLERFYSLSQVEYCRNFIFRRHFPIRAIFERSCELALWRMTADKLGEMFGLRLTKRVRGKVSTVLEQIEHGRHIFRAYCKHSFIKQYEKFRTFLRNELCSNNLTDFRLKKGLAHLPTVRTTFLAITDRFAGFQAECLNVHGDFALLQRLALPITVGRTRFPGIRIQDTRLIRLMEVLLHAGTQVRGSKAAELHHAICATFELAPDRYRLTQLRYDLRKLKGHALVERVDHGYFYRLTTKGQKVALLFMLFHHRLCGPLAHSLFHHRPSPRLAPSPLETALHKADDSIQEVLELLQAA